MYQFVFCVLNQRYWLWEPAKMQDRQLPSGKLNTGAGSKQATSEKSLMLSFVPLKRLLTQLSTNQVKYFLKRHPKTTLKLFEVINKWKGV